MLPLFFIFVVNHSDNDHISDRNARMWENNDRETAC